VALRRRTLDYRGEHRKIGGILLVVFQVGGERFQMLSRAWRWMNMLLTSVTVAEGLATGVWS
jgi:hypothetical protein